MDLSSLKNMMFSKPSLANYLGGDKYDSSALAAAQQATQAKISTLMETANTASSASGVQISLSAEAQALLAQNAEENADASINGIQKGAQSFFMNFLEDIGVDFSKLSNDAQEFIQGFNQLIVDTGATLRDSSTDRMEQEYHKGNRDVYTLLGTNSRLRLAIDYQDDKAQKLTITDMNGGTVSIAEMTIKNAGQANASIEVTRQQREYANGMLMDMREGDPISMALYS